MRVIGVPHETVTEALDAWSLDARAALVLKSFCGLMESFCLQESQAGRQPREMGFY